MLEHQEIKRDEYGDWTHPAILEFCGDREFIPAADWEAWKAEHQIETAITSMEYELDEDHPAWIRHFDEGNPGSLGWNPEPPGPEWRILSIHDTEDGPVAIWYREKPSEAQDDE